VRVLRGLKAAREILERRSILDVEIPPEEAARFHAVFGAAITAEEFVRRVYAEVGADGDAGVRRIGAALGETSPDRFEVAPAEIDRALGRIPPELRADLETAADRVRRFHEQTAPKDWTDEAMGVGQLFRPVERSGVYAPGGRAAYPSSILMTAIPAKVAGVGRLVVASPGGPNGSVPDVTLAAARIAGADAVYAIGGAQAIAALALGTESVPKVDVIAGPGNIFVILAMRQAFGTTGVSTLPGPTETLLIADDGAEAAEVAADLLAQAEHDPMAAPLLLTDSARLAKAVEAELELQLADLPRAEIARAALGNRGGIGIVADLEEAVELANEYAPEHLCLLTDDPWALVPKVRNAGGIFVGAHSPEVLGDYVAGPSHVMPVGGTARFASPVNVTHFQKTVSLFALAEDAAGALAPVAARLARYEGLEAHARAAEIRLPEGESGRSD
jgi:histidinol dehydrogenase